MARRPEEMSFLAGFVYNRLSALACLRFFRAGSRDRGGDNAGMDEESGEDEEGRENESEMDETEDETEAADGFDPEKLRVYELRKLKYYFAVLECSSPAAAETIYRLVRWCSAFVGGEGGREIDWP